MNVLVTNADNPFAVAVADLLGDRDHVRRIGWEEPLEADTATDALVAASMRWCTSDTRAPAASRTT